MNRAMMFLQGLTHEWDALQRTAMRWGMSPDTFTTAVIDGTAHITDPFKKPQAMVDHARSIIKSLRADFAQYARAHRRHSR